MTKVLNVHACGMCGMFIEGTYTLDLLCSKTKRQFDDHRSIEMCMKVDACLLSQIAHVRRKWLNSHVVPPT